MSRTSSKPVVKLLGKKATVASSPGKAVLDRVPNPHSDTLYVARFVPHRNSHRCARLPTNRISPISLSTTCRANGCWKANRSSSISLRSAITVRFMRIASSAIGKRVAKLLQPRYIRIGGYWYPRGGIPIDVFWQSGHMPKNIWLPDQVVAPYRGRGEHGRAFEHRCLPQPSCGFRF